jgi:hypothetical protein
MTGAEFVERYRATGQALDAYVAVLPLWVNVWRAWMFFVFTLAIVFVWRKVEARWLGLTMVLSIFAYNVVAMLHGVGRFPSIAFVVFWTPLALYCWSRRGRMQGDGRFDQVYTIWLDIATATLFISLAFDVYNVLYSLVRGVA